MDAANISDSGSGAMSENSRLRRPTRRELDAAWTAVHSELAPTPLLATDLPTVRGPVAGWLKLETFQPTGSFKVRGAVAALRTLPPGRRAVSASAGNHALGMAWAATRLGTPVTVVTARNASAAKIAELEAFTHLPASPVTLVRHGLSYEEAEAYARGVVATDPDAIYVSAYSDYAVIAGAATAGREIDATLPSDEPVTVVTCLGGGGLASGLALWAAERGHTHLVGAEAAESPAVSAAVAAGRPVEVPVGVTIADGLAGNLEPGCPTPEILGEAVAAGGAAFASCTEDQLRGAMRWLFRSHGLVAEGAGAAAVAAVMTGQVNATGPVVVLVTGRNVTAETYAEVLGEL
jgi:threonine dehydratase